jgi:hypothetical protein
VIATSVDVVVAVWTANHRTKIPMEQQKPWGLPVCGGRFVPSRRNSGGGAINVRLAALNYRGGFGRPPVTLRDRGAHGHPFGPDDVLAIADSR